MLKADFRLRLYRSGVQYRLHTNIMLSCNPAGRAVSRLRRIEQPRCALPQMSREQDNCVSFAILAKGSKIHGVGSS
ncbi:hypothetical protein CDEST_03196 [Colletotrichum destructivum]|uniref:Uncharacterized protein n=1 Tax=Colletotrichum destructivum TaxID=34406 RepID=A0AAX4I4V2_9PEZI|nr:hypothetical protein CDEST_03196 [Colletotrichum destructivum]